MKKMLFVALCLMLLPLQANAQARFGFGLRVGASGYTDDVFGEGVKTHVGFIGSGNLLLLVNEWFLVGLAAEGDLHQLKLEATNDDLARLSSVSLIPFVELRGPSHTYLFLGVGCNLNYSRADSALDALGYGTAVKLEMNDTIAFKGGAGWDLFVNDHLAVNIEVGWKYNKGGAYLLMPADGGTTKIKLKNGFDASVVTGLCGLRYYF